MTLKSQGDQGSEPGILVSLSPLILLIALLTINIIIFKDDATSGANQLALLISGAFTVLVGTKLLGCDYKHIEQRIISSIGLSMQAMLILLIVGSLIGLWILSGIVPTMIFYGLKLINPAIFLPLACIVCAIVSLSTGSSWSTTGTIGISFIGIGEALGLPSGMVAGAIISGAYFGDKMSPLSDTTNLAPAMAGTDLITHIKHMVYSSGPAIIIALIGFTICTFFYSSEIVPASEINEITAGLEKTFNITAWLFLVPLIVIVMVKLRVPALPAMFLGTFLGAIAAVIFQWDLLNASGPASLRNIYMKLIEVGAFGYSGETGIPSLDSLLQRGGMKGMLSTVWLILSAMVFGGAMDATGILEKLANTILKGVKTSAGLVGSTLGSCIFMNMTASDQYLAIVVPGRMFKSAYERFKLKPKNLSRALEDAGTVTSVLVPWNSGGAYNSSVLGVGTLTYLPFCFFNLASPIVSLVLAFTGWTIESYEEAKENQ